MKKEMNKFFLKCTQVSSIAMLLFLSFLVVKEFFFLIEIIK